MICPESNGADFCRDYEKINLCFSADWNLGLFGVKWLAYSARWWGLQFSIFHDIWVTVVLPRPVSHLFACSSVSCPMPVITASNGEFNFRFRCKPTGLESPTSTLDLWAHNDVQIFANGVRNTVIFIKLVLDLAHFSLRDCCLYSKPSPLSSPEYVCITTKRSINLSENHIWCSTALGWLWLNLSPK
jgi:hypothetical protein